MPKPKAKALSTVLDRATDAAVKNAAAQEVIRKQQYDQTKELSVQIAREKLETATTSDDWTTTTDFQHIRLAHVLDISPMIKIVNPVGTSDLLLAVGGDPLSWPTIKNLAHLGSLLTTYGLQ